jgi:hypothetical protein
MIKYILISILIYIIETGIIVLLIYFLFRKRQRKINEFNNSIIQKEKIIDTINKKTAKQKKEVENEIKNASNLNDLIDIFSKL